MEEQPYELNWPGKYQCIRTIQKPAQGFLIPVKSESVNWETSENLFIEGDNLEVMKLLSPTYIEQIKMIYIDPPYNTGKQFIYADNYKESVKAYRAHSREPRFEAKDAHGRTHAKWMSMMYPRLSIARTLMRKDGVIFISIDEHEVHHLKIIMNEIFGEDQFLGCVTVVSNWKGRSDGHYYATAHNYLLAYAREAFESKGVPLPENYWDAYSEVDERGHYRLQGLRKRGSSARKEDRPNLCFPLYVNTLTGKISLQQSERFLEEIWPRLSNGHLGRWRWNIETVALRLEELLGKPVGTKKRWDIFQKDYAETAGNQRRIKPKTVWMGPEFSNERGSLELKKIFGVPLFDNPKPTALIRYCLEQAVDSGDLVLDFFAGSGTTAQAILEMNQQVGGHRKFICIQTPEPCDEGSNAYLYGFSTIAEISKERIRRVLHRISGEPASPIRHQASPHSPGFRVLKYQPL